MSDNNANAARRPGPTVQDYLDQEIRSVPDVLRINVNDGPALSDIPVDRYISLDWHRREVELLWRRVWQVACREEEIPEVGDHVVYDVAYDSLIISRTSTTQIRAFYNSCLHRGRQLRRSGGKVMEFRCPFHGFTWNLDGTLKEIPMDWDFSHIDKNQFCLPEAKVDTWAGFVFINMDPGCEPLERFLGGLPNHWLRWPLERKFKALHVAKILDCNWKVALEAFIESMHAAETHPQLLPWLGDSNTQYDVMTSEQNWSRLITPQGVPSPSIAASLTENEVLNSYLLARVSGQSSGRDLNLNKHPEIPPGATARQVLAEELRNQLSAEGADCQQLTDCELLDAIEYFLFPNFCLWAGAKSNVLYRFRPSQNNPDRCIVEVMFLAATPPEGDPPRPAKIHWLEQDEKFSSLPELGILGPVFDQDYHNLPFVQKGLKSTRKPTVTLAEYQESLIRHFHQTLVRWVAEKRPPA